MLLIRQFIQLTSGAARYRDGRLKARKNAAFQVLDLRRRPLTKAKMTARRGVLTAFLPFSNLAQTVPKQTLHTVEA
jgi:hypothetical protein